MSNNGLCSDTLPQEILDLIIDALSDDKPSLRSWSLVCRSCIWISQQSLFRKFKLDCGISADRRLEEFNNFLQKSAQIGEHIRTFKIFSSYVVEVMYLHEDSPQLGPGLLASILWHMPNLSFLSLKHVQLTSSLLVGDYIVSTCEGFSVEKLEFEDVGRGIFWDSFISILQLFRYVGKLTGQFVDCEYPQNVEPAVLLDNIISKHSFNQALKIRKLNIPNNRALVLPLLKICSAMASLEDLSTLHVYCPDIESLDAFASFLMNSGSHLTSIKFNFMVALERYYEGCEELFRQRALYVSCCTSLRDVCLHFDVVPYSKATYAMFFSYSSHILDHIPPSVRHITFNLRVSPESQLHPNNLLLGDIDWPHIQSSLLDKDSVTFQVDKYPKGRHDSPNESLFSSIFHELFKTRLSSLYVTGTLRFRNIDRVGKRSP